MKKTVSVNIKGLNFMIEEDAYEMLHHYMQRLEKSLSGQKGSKDIIEDIELRIAELCQLKLSDKKQVIEKEDIASIIATLGQPEDFIEEPTENDHEFKSHEFKNEANAKKQLYRDIENAKIAGVAAGLSNYFNIDLIVVRIIFLIFLFVGGFGFPLYIILWIVLPKTNSSIDRLRMQGKPITVDSVKEEIELAASRFGKSSKGFADRMRKEENLGKRFSSLGRIIVKIVGFGLIAMGVFFLIIFLVLFFGGLRFVPIQVQDSFISFTELGQILLSDGNDVFMVLMGIILLAASIILFLISNGTYLLVGLKSKWARMSSLALVIFGIIGFVLCSYIGAKTGRDFASHAQIKKQILTIDSPELKLSSFGPNIKYLDGYEISEEDNNSHPFQVLSIKGNTITNTGIEFLLKSSEDSMYHISQSLSADGYSYEKALSKAKNIKNSAIYEDSILKIDRTFSFPKRDKLRDQSVKIIIEIPKGKKVKIGEKSFSPIALEEEEIEMNGYLNDRGKIEIWD